MIATMTIYDSADPNELSDEYARLCDQVNDLSTQYWAPKEPGIYYTPKGEIWQLRWDSDAKVYLKARRFQPQTRAFRGVWRWEGKVRWCDRLTLKQLIELSLSIGLCMSCGRALTAEESVKRSIGPVCIKNYDSRKAAS